MISIGGNMSRRNDATTTRTEHFRKEQQQMRFSKGTKDGVGDIIKG